MSASYGLFIFKDADCESIVALDRSAYISDKDNLYHFDPPIVVNNKAKYNNTFDYFNASIDADTFEKNRAKMFEKYPDIIGWWHPKYPFHLEVQPDTKIGYHKTEMAVFYIFEVDNRHDAFVLPNHTVIRNVDLDSFEILSIDYAKDRNNVYCKNRIVKEADAASFQLISNKLAKDKNGLFFNGYPVDCDTDSFELLLNIKREYSFELIARDKNHIYVDTWTKFGKVGMRTGYDRTLTIAKKIADPSSFKMLSDYWGIDQTQIYGSFTPHKHADFDSFEFLFKAKYDDWARDKQYLYQSGDIVKNIDGSSFIALNEWWGKDAENVFSFYTGRIRSSIDVDSFKVTDDNGGCEDKNFVYYFDNSGALKKKKK